MLHEPLLSISGMFVKDLKRPRSTARIRRPINDNTITRSYLRLAGGFGGAGQAHDRTPDHMKHNMIAVSLQSQVLVRFGSSL